MVEQRFVVPLAAGSIPVDRPIKISLERFFLSFNFVLYCYIYYKFLSVFALYEKIVL